MIEFPKLSMYPELKPENLPLISLAPEDAWKERARRSFEKLENEQQRLDAEKLLCQTRLDFLCKMILKFNDWDICHDELQEWRYQNKDNRFQLILMPRGHLKSSILSIADTVQIMLREPDTSILLASAVWNSSRSFLSEIKEYLSNKSILPALFGKFNANDTKWTSDQIVINQRSKPDKTPSIDTAGIDKTMTSQHYKYIKADDLVTRENVTTSEQMEKVRNYLGDLIKLLEPDGKMEVIGTRWHDADVYGHIISNLTKEELKGDRFVVYKRQAREMGKPIFPKKFTSEKLDSLKITLGSYDYGCNYDNEPVSPDTQVFKPPFNRYFTDLGDGAIHAITFDPATSEKKNACDAVVLDGAVMRNNQLCVVEYTAFKKKEPSEMIDKIFTYVQKYRGYANRSIKVGIEINGGQEIYIKLIQEEQRKRNVFFEIVPLRHIVDKTSRIRALQPRWESGNLLLKQGMVELEEQMMRFPVGTKCDIIDALAMQLEVLTPQFNNKPKVWVDPNHR